MEHGELVKRLRERKKVAPTYSGRVVRSSGPTTPPISASHAVEYPTALVNPDGPEAADALEALQAENAKLRAAIERQAAAVRTLHHNEQTEINVLRSKQTEAHRAVATLDSEREMNALLTEENEAAQARIAALEAELAGARGLWKQSGATSILTLFPARLLQPH